MATLDKIVNTHYVPLVPPYPVIYSNNEVGIQIATLIVITEPQGPISGGKRSFYRIVTHSHPVVTYGNKHRGISCNSNLPGDYSECIVWDNVDVSRVLVIGYVNENGLVSPSDDVLLQKLNDIIMRGRLNEMFYASPFNLSKIVYRLELSGIKMPKFVVHGKVRLVLGGSNKPEKKSVTSNNIVGLPAFYLATEWSNTDDAEITLCQQIDEYISCFAFEKDNTYIEFWTHSEELQELVMKLNKTYATSK